MRTAPVVGTWRRGLSLLAGLALVATACGTDPSTPTTAPTGTPGRSATPTPMPSAVAVEPAPGSDSSVYAPNPGAILVAIDAGHGGCLDWGVPDPSERGVELAEKTLTLDISRLLRDRLIAEGIGVLMIRDGDVALAGDDYPPLGCEGPPWRDVDGDGRSGFEESGRIRTRDELQARIDLANLARADAFVSIHINSLTEDGVTFEIAASQTFYDDESPWGASSGDLADAVQAGVVAAIEPLATYDREDRGTDAVAFYVISRTWQEGDTCETPGDTWCKPHRGLAMPGALAEVGSITLREEHDLLASPEGQEAIADGLFEGLAAFVGSRDLSGRISLEGEPPGAVPDPVDGLGPPFLAPASPSVPLRLRLTNTGTAAWPADVDLMAGWEPSTLPYLAAAPGSLAPIGADIPALAPGESVVVVTSLPDAPGQRSLAWLTLAAGGELFSDAGSPPLQVVSEAN